MKAKIIAQDQETGLEFKPGDSIRFLYRGRITYARIFRITGKNFICYDDVGSGICPGTEFKKYKIKYITDITHAKRLL